MNQNTLQMVYKSFEKEEFYSRYLKEQKCREDRRQFDQQRTLKATIRNNSVVVSRGQTIIVVHLNHSIQPVTYSPISKGFGGHLIKIKVNSNLSTKFKPSKSDRFVEGLINENINWEPIESQLIVKDEQTGRLFAGTGELIIRVLGDDGGIESTALLATYLLLWTCKFPKISIKKEAVTETGFFMLNLSQFLFPFTYCEIIGQLLIDPSASEQNDSDFQICIIKDILSNKSHLPKISTKIKANTEAIPPQILKAILDIWKHQIQKLPFDVVQLQKQVESSTSSIELTIG